jgi:Rieske Fe-S protein
MEDPTVDQTRRAVLQSSAVAVVAGAAGFVAMAARDEESSTAAASAYGSPEGRSQTGDQVLAKVDDVPTDGGVILAEAQVVLTRASDGDIRGFSAVCTHQACLVTRVEDGLISCPCHGSAFDAASGEVVSGPAQRPLAPVRVQVSGDSISAD